jgi:DUF4097 and DUF4098 domain-containing protein YvlB
MPNFVTPEPISVVLDLAIANVKVTAADRTDTSVEVCPTSNTSNSDSKLAELTTVDFAGNTLNVKVPKRVNAYLLKGGSVDLAIDLPAGSQIEADAWTVELRTDGVLGTCKVKTGTGTLSLDTAGPLDLFTSSGNITVARAAGEVKVTTESGQLKVSRVEGNAALKNGNGDIQVGEVTGDLKANAGNGSITVDRVVGSVNASGFARVKVGRVEGSAGLKSADGDIQVGEVTGDLKANASNGDISVDCAHNDATAKTASGDVRVGEVSQGEVVLRTADGQVDVGVREGVAAWLDAKSGDGKVHSSMSAADAPERSDQTVKVHAYSSHGDVTIRRVPLAARS